MAHPPLATSVPARRWLALLRLLFLYVAFCYCLLEIGLASRDLLEAAPFDLPNPSYPPPPQPIPPSKPVSTSRWSNIPTAPNARPRSPT